MNWHEIMPNIDNVISHDIWRTDFHWIRGCMAISAATVVSWQEIDQISHPNTNNTYERQRKDLLGFHSQKKQVQQQICSTRTLIWKLTQFKPRRKGSIDGQKRDSHTQYTIKIGKIGLRREPVLVKKKKRGSMEEEKTFSSLAIYTRLAGVKVSTMWPKPSTKERQWPKSRKFPIQYFYSLYRAWVWLNYRGEDGQPCSPLFLFWGTRTFCGWWESGQICCHPPTNHHLSTVQLRSQMDG